jgi:hypothetical protein
MNEGIVALASSLFGGAKAPLPLLNSLRVKIKEKTCLPFKTFTKPTWHVEKQNEIPQVNYCLREIC